MLGVHEEVHGTPLSRRPWPIRSAHDEDRDHNALSDADGLCNHYYNDGFGTLWSMVFDINGESVDVCFSAPTHNSYRTFGLKDPVGITAYPTIVPIT